MPYAVIKLVGPSCAAAAPVKEHLLFRREMQYKQNELERQLEEQQTLVKRMSDQMEVALQQQQMGQYPSVTQSQLQQRTNLTRTCSIINLCDNDSVTHLLKKTQVLLNDKP